MDKHGSINEIFDVISQQVRNWRRLGRLIGVEEYILDNIEQDNANKYHRLYECLKYKKEAAKSPVGWGFLKEKILKFTEGVEIVDSLEKRFPSLLDSINEQNIDQETKQCIFIDIFDIISMRLRDWKQLAKKLDTPDYVSIEIEGNDKYKDHLQEKVYRCIDEKKSSDPDWFYWRNILLKMKEKDLVEDIEILYPVLLIDDKINLADVDHQIIEDFGIYSHHADRVENFDCLPVKLKHKIKVCMGAGESKIYCFKKIEDMCSIQKDYFDKYNILQLKRKYDFSNITKTEECKILNIQYAWLEKNTDSGFTVKGYDAKKHLQAFSDDYINNSPQEDCIITCSEKHKVILHISLATNNNIKKSMRENCYKIRPIQTANQCLSGKSFIYVPVTLHDKLEDEVNNELNCKTCIDSKLVLVTDTFKDLKRLEDWWENLMIKLKHIKQQLANKNDTFSDFLKSIVGYMAMAPFNLPTYQEGFKNEIKEAQKLIMLTQEQQKILYSKQKHKILKGSFGSGKTIIAQQILKLVANSPYNDDQLVYYMLHAANSIYVQEMKKMTNNFNNKNIKKGLVTDFVKGKKSLSSILKHLLEINPGITVHLFIEEFNGENLDKEEIDRVSVLLEKVEFKNSHIVIVAQSMESKRFEIQVDKRLLYDNYNYSKLVEDTSFQLFELSYILRSSKRINDIIDVAIPILREVATKSTVPDSDISSKQIKPTLPNQIRRSSRIKEKERIQSSTTDGMIEPQKKKKSPKKKLQHPLLQI